ncbi:MAG: RHS repeat-associated core domain-containing protein [Paludibacteraceae bacterium]|nr:RHS repeat-associated core domain-containing protein [Paludibacteraceae bacterium]
MTTKIVQKTRKGIRFYHPDHLGSTTVVTDLDGEETQNVAYIPYGEVFVEQRNGTWNTPYLFNAKELDEETGLYYYGARYLDPTGTRWLSVDPLFEKYVGMTPYGYCAGNPVRLVDPNGLELGVSVDGETYTYNPEVKQNVYKGKNNVIRGFVSTLNKINSTKIGHKVLNALHKSNKKYLVTNESSTKGTHATIKDKDGVVKNKMGDSKNLIDLSHELFHSYQYEKGQGGASIFNEIEAYVFSNRLVNEYNKNLPDDYIKYYENYENDDSFTSSADFMNERPLSQGAKVYENAAKSLVEGEMFSPKDFNTAWSYFRSYSSKNDDGLYNSKQYKFKLPQNNSYLLRDFYSK